MKALPDALERSATGVAPVTVLWADTASPRHIWSWLTRHRREERPCSGDSHRATTRVLTPHRKRTAMRAERADPPAGQPLEAPLSQLGEASGGGRSRPTGQGDRKGPHPAPHHSRPYYDYEGYHIVAYHSKGGSGVERGGDPCGRPGGIACAWFCPLRYLVNHDQKGSGRVGGEPCGRSGDEQCQ